MPRSRQLRAKKNETMLEQPISSPLNPANRLNILDTVIRSMSRGIQTRPGNPVRAKLVDDIADYEWSSYNERCLLSEKSILDEIYWNNSK